MKTIEGKSDVYERITNQVIAAIENGAGEFKMPWHGCDHTRPVNANTKNCYQGINILALWASQMTFGFTTSYWGTYRQWQMLDAQVRKGEKGTTVAFFKDLEVEKTDGETGDSKNDRIYLARSSSVFNADQVDGWSPPSMPTREDKTERIASADRFIDGTGATIRYGGSAAFYFPHDDLIQVPNRERFFGTDTSSPTDAFYSVILHELTHWSAAESRLNRLSSQRFGDDPYAMEEFVAEFGSAILCCDLGVTAQPRADHAAYIDRWLKVIKADKKVLFTAASLAMQAVRFLHGLQPAAKADAA